MATDVESSGDPTNGDVLHGGVERSGVLLRHVGNGPNARVKVVALYRAAGKRNFSSENSSRQREKKEIVPSW
jgi:hypothetical protein